ncbi:MAG TPA: STAS/SEC14 domain-containing protein, partial [Rhizomicrobium sp.]|nr:STAS/SEC14 domain-containing protein [Rhizomicrobium sp.]
AGAAWEDTKLGIAHWGDWGRLAVITDTGWITDAVRLFAPLFHHPVRAFPNAEVEAAKAWITETGPRKAA